MSLAQTLNIAGEHSCESTRVAPSPSTPTWPAYHTIQLFYFFLLIWVYRRILFRQRVCSGQRRSIPAEFRPIFNIKSLIRFAIDSVAQRQCFLWNEMRSSGQGFLFLLIKQASFWLSERCGRKRPLFDNFLQTDITFIFPKFLELDLRGHFMLQLGIGQVQNAPIHS